MRRKIFYLMLVANTVTASPIFLTPSTAWQGKSPFILGNCVNPSPYCQVIAPKDTQEPEAKWIDLAVSNAPQTKSFERLPGYQEFREYHKQRSQRIFGLWDRGANKNGVLTLIPHDTSLHQFDFELPFSVTEGALTIADAYYKNDWHTLLVVLAKDRLTQKSVLWVFDITDPSQNVALLIERHLKDIITEKGKPQLVRLSNGCFGIAVIGSLQEQGSLELLLLDSLKNSRRIKIGSNRLSFLVAVDLYQQGIVDRMYMGGSNQLWVIDCVDIDQVSIKKLADVEIIGLPAIIPDHEGQGTNIYFLGNFAKQKGLWVLQDNDGEGASYHPIKLVIEGDFIGFFMRFGYFLLVPKEPSLMPLAFDLPSHQPLPIQWQTFYADKSRSSFEAKLIGLMWEPKQQKEMILILNSSCQLNILSGAIPHHRYGRVSWRQLYKE